MATTADIITNSFKFGYSPHGYVANIKNWSDLFNRTCVIPVKGRVFEIPLFALKNATSFGGHYWCNADTVAVHIMDSSRTAPYSTVETNVKYCHDVPVTRGINKILLPHSDNFYYCTAGAVFDRFWKPLCVASWKAEIIKPSPDSTAISYLKPLFRIDPRVMLDKKDVMQKFITGKWMKILLENYVEYPDSYNQTGVSIRIEPIPLQIRTVRQPSIATTTEHLIGILKQNIDEICA